MKQDESAEDSGGALPPPPDALAAVFPRDRIELITAYAERLAGDGVVRGLIGPREAPRLWDRHIINCGLMAPLLPAGGSVADVGSGAGLPGLVLAIARPDVHITLIEPLLRRTTFLEEVVADLGLDNVAVARGKADAFVGTAAFDLVTSRAVAPLDALIRWCMPLVKGSGEMVAMKGSNAEAEIEESRSSWEGSGCSAPVVELVGTDIDDALGVDPIRVVRVAWADPEHPVLASTGNDAGTDAAGASRVGLPGSRRKSRPRGAAQSGARNKRRKA